MPFVFNFPSSFDHFEGGLGDFPHQEGTRILQTPPLPRKTLMSLMWLNSPSLDLYANFKHSHSAPAYTVGEGVGDLITYSEVM